MSHCWIVLWNLSSYRRWWTFSPYRLNIRYIGMWYLLKIPCVRNELCQSFGNGVGQTNYCRG